MTGEKGKAREAEIRRKQELTKALKGVGLKAKGLHGLLLPSDDVKNPVGLWWKNTSTTLKGNEESGYTFGFNDGKHQVAFYKVGYQVTNISENVSTKVLRLEVTMPLPDGTYANPFVLEWGRLKKQKYQPPAEEAPLTYPPDIPLQIIDRLNSDLDGLTSLVSEQRGLEKIRLAQIAQAVGRPATLQSTSNPAG